MCPRRAAPRPWSVDEQAACFIVRDADGQALAYVYFEEEPGRRAAAHLLADGMIEGDVIECCMHMGSFHIPTGKVMQPPCEVPLRTYQVVLKDEDVFADLKRNAAGEP